MLTWDLRAERRLTMHREKHGGINEIALAQDQTTIVSAGQEKILTFWDLRQAEANSYVELNEEVLSLDLSTSNKYLATSGTGQIVKLWDMRAMSRGPVSQGAGHSRNIVSVRFAGDDKQVISCSGDNSILVWNVYDA